MTDDRQPTDERQQADDDGRRTADERRTDDDGRGPPQYMRGPYRFFRGGGSPPQLKLYDVPYRLFFLKGVESP